jgi:hypothetical protein
MCIRDSMYEMPYFLSELDGFRIITHRRSEGIA